MRHHGSRDSSRKVLIVSKTHKGDNSYRTSNREFKTLNRENGGEPTTAVELSETSVVEGDKTFENISEIHLTPMNDKFAEHGFWHCGQISEPAKRSDNECIG